MNRNLAIAGCALLWTVGTVEVSPVTAADPVQIAATQLLAPTIHPPISRDASALWLAPTADDHRRTADRTSIAIKAGIEASNEGRYSEAVRLLAAPAATQHPLAGYAAYHAAVSHLELGNLDQARRLLKDLRVRLTAFAKATAVKKPDTTADAARADTTIAGYLVEAAAVAEAEVAEEQKDYADAVEIYEALLGQKTAVPEEIWIRLGRAALAAGDRAQASQMFARVYYEFPFSDLALGARSELDRLQALEPLAPRNARYRLDLGRAERLFIGKRYADAQAAFEALRRHAVGDDRDLIALRLAEIDFFRNRTKAARDALRKLIDDEDDDDDDDNEDDDEDDEDDEDEDRRQAEALYFYASTLRNLGLTSDWLRTARRLIDRFPGSSWTEDALNDEAAHYIRNDEDAAADEVLRELYAGFPGGQYAERAAWKIGWRAYRAGRYADTVHYFETTARQFPRSDYRPSFLYWSGRALEALGNDDAANARYRLATTDYLNTYFGRLAADRLTHRGRAVALTDLQFDDDESSVAGAFESQWPPTHELVRLLLSLDLYDEALDEVRYAQRTWGDSPVLLATIAWIHNQQGDLRAGVVAMKRAYPQYMASGGELLPAEILKVIFPVDFWDEIRAQAARHNLNPYLLAALVAQESAFDPKIKSSAKAVGLMQLLPSTGRMYARKLRLGSYRSSMLTTAKTNLTMGTAYFADLVKKFGATHLALAAYNAGDSRVARWRVERAGENLDREEFIDDIPFAETQAYVRKILSTSEDYRRLYGDTSRATR